MTFGLKDVIYFVSFGVSIGVVWMTFSNRISNVEKSMDLVKKVIFKKSGELSFMTIEAYTQREVAIQKALDKSDTSIDEMKEEIREMSQNILVIMVHMNIDTKKVNLLKKGASNE